MDKGAGSAAHLNIPLAPHAGTEMIEGVEMEVVPSIEAFRRS